MNYADPSLYLPASSPEAVRLAEILGESRNMLRETSLKHGGGEAAILGNAVK